MAIKKYDLFRSIWASCDKRLGGMDAMNLRIAEAYLGEFGKLAKTNNTMIIPSNLADVAGMVSSVSRVFSEATAKKEK